MKKYKILQVGTYSSQNKGDAAMELSTADELTHRYGKGVVTISTPFPELDRAFYSEYSVVKCRRRRLIWASIQLFRCMLYGFFNKVLRIKANFLIPENELQEFVSSDLIVDLSGDMLTEDYGPHVAYSHFLPILMPYFLGRPYALCAQSIGPFKWTKFVAKFILEHAEFVTVRDEISLGYLKNDLKIENSNLEMTADMAFLLRPANKERIDELLSIEGITLGGKKVLGISLSGLVEGKFHKKNPESKNIDFYKLFAKQLDKLIEKYNLNLVFVPHVTGPSDSKNDRLVGSKLKELMNNNIDVIQGDYRPDELKGIISRFDYMLGARMHANIAALSSCVPTVAISYSHKTPGIMNMLGQDEYVLDIENLNGDEIITKVSSMIESSSSISSLLSKNLPSVRDKSEKNIELMDRLLSKQNNHIRTVI